MDTLATIVAHTRQQLAARKPDVRLLEQRAAAHTPRGFAKALRQKAAGGPAIIAELKKASPSRGLIREDFDVPALAASLAGSGAAALSVLTDEEFFQGSLANLERASATVTIPCLRKDFMVDEFQMLEARAHNADAILLIVAALTDAELKKLAAAARRQQLDILCEVHDGEELQRALDLDCDAIGVNSRNLKTFDVNVSTTLALAAQLPPDRIRVAESGIHTAEDIVQLRAAGYDAFLIGESLMRQPDPGTALAALLQAAEAAALAGK